MVKAIWAVACTSAALAGLIAFGSGCASTKPKTQESGRTDVGGGPGSTLTRLIELQKQAGSSTMIPADSHQGSAVQEVKIPQDAPKADKPPVERNSPPRNDPPASVATPSPAASLPEVKKESVPAGPLDRPAQPAPIMAPPGDPLSATDQNYRLGPEDVVHISVWGNEEITLDVTVRPDGRISVPLIQDVQAEGLTAVELADVIHSRLLAFIREPQVSVIVTKVNAPKIYVIGNVARPGTYPLRGDMSVLQALSLAGGFTEFASKRRIKVVRQRGGRQDVRRVNYFEIIDEGDTNYLLRPGDTIVVP